MGCELNTIYYADCLEIMKEIPDSSVDCLVTDPPYRLIAGGDSNNKFGGRLVGGMLNRKQVNSRSGKLFSENDIQFDDWLPIVYRIMKPKTHSYIMVNDRNMQELLNISEKCGFKLVNILVWKKNNATPNKFYMKNIEFIVMLRKGGERWIKYMDSKQCIEIENIIGNKMHPTEKPVRLMEYLIENSTDVGDTVLDPFMGSGTTAISCININRNYMGMEKDEEYYKLALKRIAQHKVQQTLFRG